jgi:hypothetical protein
MGASFSDDPGAKVLRDGSMSPQTEIMIMTSSFSLLDNSTILFLDV